MHPGPGAAEGRPPQQVPGAMATKGISQSGRPEAAPAKLQAAKAKSDPSPGGARWTKGDPQEGRWAPREPRESLLFPGQCIVSRRGLDGAEGAGDGPALLPRGPQRRAQPTSAAQRTPFPAAAAQPMAKSRRVLPAPLGRCC